MKAMEGSPFNIFSWIPRGNVDQLEIDFLCYKMESNNDPKNDLEFIKLVQDISSIYENYKTTTPDHWAYHSKEISAGKYPLELLPENVRPLAQKLYYN